MYTPSQEEFLKLTQKGNLIPIYQEILGDLDTPVSCYYKLAKKAAYSFLLESVEGEEKIARFSFLAKDPELIFQSKDKKAQILRFKNGRVRTQQKKIPDSPLKLIRDILKEYKFVPIAGLPRFCGGLVGYISYDTVRFFEKIPHTTKDDLNLPDMLLVLAKDLVIFDHLNHNIKIVSCAFVPSQASLKEKIKIYRRSTQKINQIFSKLQHPLTKEKNIGRKSPRDIELKVRSNFTQEQFEKIVARAKEDIQAGEIIQTVLSQRFCVDLKTDSFNIYRALRSLNPSPYMYFLHLKDMDIVGSSPELLVRCEDGVVETRPIAGTRPRGKSPQEDEELAQELLNDPKEKAEHIMLVDLGRNDLGRVCQEGTVKVTEFMSIEKYSHVMHIVSNVKGQLRKDKDALDVLRATFPAGTVSGAPKIRAMEIIESLEKISRGPYAGCIGYFSFSGNFDSCITIRTIVIHKKKAYIQAGAGIVADSNPTKEYKETVNKAKAQMLAIELAYKGND